MAFKRLLTLFAAVMALGQICHAQSYSAEGYFVVDNQAVQNYVNNIPGNDAYAVKRKVAVETITQDIGYLLSEVNRLFSSMKSQGLQVEIRKRDLVILDKNIFPASAIQLGNAIDSGVGLRLFRDWLGAQGAYSKLGYDFAIFWTGYDMSGSAGSNTAGYANVGTVCDPSLAIGLVEFNANYMVAHTTAHEIAHILGSSHDGAASQAVMAASSDPSQRQRWSFSKCSASDIIENINILTSNCLLKTNPASQIPSTTWTSYTGQLLNKDVICQRSLNDLRSYMCLSSNLYSSQLVKGDIVCQQIYCRIPGTSYCRPAFTSEGMICDKSKRCQNGKCLPDTSPAAVNTDATCVLGDQKTLEFPNVEFYGTCQEYINKFGKVACYNSLISELCCATCKKYSTGQAGCQYGDKNADCVKYPKASVCPAYGGDMCCAHCKGFVGKRSLRDYLSPNITIIVEKETLIMENDLKAPYKRLAPDHVGDD